MDEKTPLEVAGERLEQRAAAAMGHAEPTDQIGELQGRFVDGLRVLLYGTDISAEDFTTPLLNMREVTKAYMMHGAGFDQAVQGSLTQMFLLGFYAGQETERRA